MHTVIHGITVSPGPLFYIDTSCDLRDTTCMCTKREIGDKVTSSVTISRKYFSTNWHTHTYTHTQSIFGSYMYNMKYLSVHTHALIHWGFIHCTWVFCVLCLVCLVHVCMIYNVCLVRLGGLSLLPSYSSVLCTTYCHIHVHAANVQTWIRGGRNKHKPQYSRHLTLCNTEMCPQGRVHYRVRVNNKYQIYIILTHFFSSKGIQQCMLILVIGPHGLLYIPHLHTLS